MAEAESSERVFPRRRYANGLTLVTQPMEGVESVAIGYLIAAGARTEGADEGGISHLVESLGLQGTQQRDVRALTEAFEEIGGHPGTSADTEFSSYSVSVLGRNLAPALELLTEVVLRPGFVPDEIPKARDRILQEIAQVEDEPMRKVLDLARREYFAGHPLGNDVLGSVESVSAMTREDLLGYWRRRYTAPNVVLSVAGKLDFEAVARQVEELCAGWPGGESAAPTPPPPPRRFATVLHKETVQQHLCLSCPGLPVGHPDYFALALMTATLGGSMNSRLFLEVREKRSLAYGVGAYFTPLKETGLLRVYAGTTPERAPETVRVIMDELSKMEAGGVTEEELRRAKTLLKSNLVMRSESTAVRRRAIAASWWYEGRLRTLEEIKALIDSVTTEQIAGMAAHLGLTSLVGLTAIGPRGGEELTGGRI